MWKIVINEKFQFYGAVVYNNIALDGVAGIVDCDNKKYCQMDSTPNEAKPDRDLCNPSVKK